MLAFEGIVVLALDIYRIPGSNLSCRCRVTTRGMWTDNGQMLRELHMVGVGFRRAASRCLVAYGLCWQAVLGSEPLSSGLSAELGSRCCTDAERVAHWGCGVREGSYAEYPPRQHKSATMNPINA